MYQPYQQTNWWLIRHAPVMTDKLYGQMDVGADFSDAARLEDIARSLPAKAVFYSSDLQRCIQTAMRIQAYQPERPLTIEQFAQLREQSFGNWEGQSYSEVEANDAEAYADFWLNPAGNVPSGGESFTAMSKRVTALMERWVTEKAGQDIVISAHAGPIRAMIGYALKISPQQTLTFSIAPLSVTRLISYAQGADASWQVDCINDCGGFRE